jgi:hypothetical protein
MAQNPFRWRPQGRAAVAGETSGSWRGFLTFFVAPIKQAFKQAFKPGSNRACNGAGKDAALPAGALRPKAASRLARCKAHGADDDTRRDG